MEREYCAAWPQELKEAERRRYRAACRVKMLEAQLDRIGPEEFDQLMEADRGGTGRGLRGRGRCAAAEMEVLQRRRMAIRKAPCINADQSQMQEAHTQAQGARYL